MHYALNNVVWLRNFKPICSQNPARFIWISPPKHNEECFAELACHLAEQQVSRGDYFLIALPWTSDFWNSQFMSSLMNFEHVAYTTVQLEAYDPSLR